MQTRSKLKNTKFFENIGGEVKIQQLFKLMVDNNSSDLHITVGSSPGLRIFNKIVRVKTPKLTSEDTKRLIYQVLTEEQKNKFEKEQELDFFFFDQGVGEV